MAPTSFLTLFKDALGVGDAHPPPPPLSARTQVHVGTSNDNGNDCEQAPASETDPEKQVYNATPTETGVVGIQAAQAIWGKHGCWLVIAG